MPSDIYKLQEPPGSSRGKRSAVSQRRDEYLRATGEEVVPHHRHHPRRHHHRSSGEKVAFFGFGLLALLTALIIIGSVLLAIHDGSMEKGAPANGPVANRQDVREAILQ